METPLNESGNRECDINIHLYFDFGVKGLEVTARFESPSEPGAFLAM